MDSNFTFALPALYLCTTVHVCEICPHFSTRLFTIVTCGLFPTRDLLSLAFGHILGQHSRLEVSKMATQLTDEERLKEVVKSALVEVLEERKDLVREVIEEALEDAALARAIEEGDRTGIVNREEILRTLDGNH